MIIDGPGGSYKKAKSSSCGVDFPTLIHSAVHTTTYILL